MTGTRMEEEKVWKEATISVTGVAALAGHAVLVKVGQQAGQLLELGHHLAKD